MNAMESKFYQNSLRYLKGIDISLGRIANALAVMNDRENSLLGEKKNFDRIYHGERVSDINESDLIEELDHCKVCQNNCKAGM